MGSATITLGERSRILASATMTVGDNPNPLARCWLNAGGDPTETANDISARPQGSPGGGSFNVKSLAVVGSVVKPAGVHTIRLYCAAAALFPEVSEVDLIVWAGSP
jgi:hypothetical protein